LIFYGSGLSGLGLNPRVLTQKTCRCASANHFPVIIDILLALKALSRYGCQFLPLLNDNIRQILSAVFRMISVDFISAFLPVKEIGALMTIIGIWQEKIRKFGPLTLVTPNLCNYRPQLLKDFRVR
jgi:hypothetical protein